MGREEALYLKIHDRLVSEIHDGKYPAGQRLPTEAELMRREGVARITVRNALNLLAKEGYIDRSPRRGSIVRERGATGFPAPAGSPVVVLIMGNYAYGFGYGVMSGILEKCAEYGYHLIIKESRNNQKKEEAIFQDLKKIRYSGLIVQPAVGEEYNPWLVHAVYGGFPLVMFDRMLPGIHAPYVGTDNIRMSELAVSKLLQQGHEYISLITLTGEQTSSIRERITGFTRACAKAGVPVHYGLWMDHLLTSGTADLSENAVPDKTCEQIVRHLKKHPEITAVYATESNITLAVLKAAEQLGLKIPEQLSVVGFDQTMTDRKIAHVEQNQQQIGEQAVDLLRTLLDGDRSYERPYLIAGCWVDGETLGPVRQEP